MTENFCPARTEPVRARAATDDTPGASATAAPLSS